MDVLRYGLIIRLGTWVFCSSMRRCSCSYILSARPCAHLASFPSACMLRSQYAVPHPSCHYRVARVALLSWRRRSLRCLWHYAWTSARACVCVSIAGARRWFARRTKGRCLAIIDRKCSFCTQTVTSQLPHTARATKTKERQTGRTVPTM